MSAKWEIWFLQAEYIYLKSQQRKLYANEMDGEEANEEKKWKKVKKKEKYSEKTNKNNFKTTMSKHQNIQLNEFCSVNKWKKIVCEKIAGREWKKS